LNISEL